MPVVGKTAAPASRNTDIRGYGSRIALAALACPGRRRPDALLHQQPSYPAQAGDPVRPGLSILSLTSLEYWIARSSRAMTTGNVAQLRRSHFSDSIFKQPILTPSLRA